MKRIKEVFIEIQKWLDEPYTFINGLVAIILIGIGLILGYIWF